MISVSLK